MVLILDGKSLSIFVHIIPIKSSLEHIIVQVREKEIDKI
jgi:hypothetical protein